MGNSTESSDLDKLTRLVFDFTERTVQRDLKSEARATRLEVQVENLIVSVNKVSDASRKAIESNTKLEAKIESLESRAIDKLNLVEDSVNENIAAIGIMGGRISALELINANRLGAEEGAKKANESNEKKATTNWTRILGLIGAVVAVIGLIYKLKGDGS